MPAGGAGTKVDDARKSLCARGECLPTREAAATCAASRKILPRMPVAMACLCRNPRGWTVASSAPRDTVAQNGNLPSPPPHARPIRSTRSGKPTDPTHTLSHDPAVRPSRARARGQSTGARADRHGRPCTRCEQLWVERGATTGRRRMCAHTQSAVTLSPDTKSQCPVAKPRRCCVNPCVHFEPWQTC